MLPEPPAPELGMVVNHYWNSPDDTGRELLETTTELGLRMLARSPVVGTVVLVDGSPTASASLAARCAGAGARYVHAGRELGLAEGYNHGAAQLTEPFVGLMANDIVPYPLDSLGELMAVATRPDVGCAFPFLTLADYVPQIARPGFLRRTMTTCEPAAMTLNLNVFRREVLEKVGGVDEGYVTGFYDPILVMKVRELGYKVVEVGSATVVHLDKLTKLTGGSTLNMARHAVDVERFAKEYPQRLAPHGIWGMTFASWPLAVNRRARALWWASEHAPTGPARRALRNVATLVEPLVTRYPATERRPADERAARRP